MARGDVWDDLEALQERVEEAITAVRARLAELATQRGVLDADEAAARVELEQLTRIANAITDAPAGL